MLHTERSLSKGKKPMCFSAHVSYISSAFLLPAGLYSLYKAFQCNRHYIPLALIPVIFSIQQFSEGVIWDTLTTQHYNLLYLSARVYLFFAFLFWPAYFPVSVYFIEPNSTRKKMLLVLTLLGLMVGCVVYIPLLMNAVPFNISCEHGAISYNIAYTQYRSALYIVSYTLIILGASLCCSVKEIKRLGLLLLASFLIAVLWFEYAFSSRWCFFSAMLSLYIVWIMCKLAPKKECA